MDGLHFYNYTHQFIRYRHDNLLCFGWKDEFLIHHLIYYNTKTQLQQQDLS